MNILQFLFDQGHFHEADEDNFIWEKCSWEDIKDLDCNSLFYKTAVKSYQEMHHLIDDGIFGPITQARCLAEAKCRCGLPDIMERRSKWPPICQREITTSHLLGRLRYSGEKSIGEAWTYGSTRWNLVSDIFLSQIEANAKIQATANRESSGILAWSYLPNNDCGEVLKQSYNNRYTWYWQVSWTTICHEIGHALGLSHGGEGIMQAANDSSVLALGEWDITQIVKLYGPLKGDPKLPNYGTVTFL